MPIAMRFTILSILLLLSLSGLAQSGSAGRAYYRTRSIEQAYDLPYLTVDKLSPSTATDLTTLLVHAPDSMRIQVKIEPWMQRGRTAYQQRVEIGPGRQEIEVHLYGLAPGAYTLIVERRGQVLGSKHFLIQR